MRNIDELTGFEGLKNSIQGFTQELGTEKQKMCSFYHKTVS